MMHGDSWMYNALTCWVVFVLQLNAGVSELICPEVAELESSVLLTCTFSGPADILYIQPDGISTATTCISGKCLTTQNDRFIGRVVNMTHSHLEIKRAQLLDEGSWKCWDTTNNIRSNCSLILRKTPSCSITSNNNTDNLTIGDELTLSIRINHYYCSRPSDLLLQTGYVLEDVVKEAKTDTVTSDSFNSTFNVSRSYIGFLNIIYNCNDKSQRINCEGIQTLLEKPPDCTISTDKDTEDLGVDESITLMVHVKIYNCSQSTEYKLQTGKRMEELVRGETRMKKNIDEFSSTFTVMESHFGHVYLFLICNNVSRSVPCEGVRALNTTQAKSPPDASDDPINYIVVIGVTTAAAVVVIIVVSIVVIVCVMKRPRKQSKNIST